MADNKSSELPDKVFTMDTISSFILIDLISQATALQQYIRGWSKEDLILWVKEQGTPKEFNNIWGNEIFLLNLRRDVLLVLFTGKPIIFAGDNTFVSF